MTQICEERYLLSLGYKPNKSKSNPSKVYRTYAFRDGEKPFCDCFPFMRGRAKRAKELGVTTDKVDWTCGHLDKLFAETCDWVQGDTDEFRWDATCPKCGGPVVNTDTVDMPEDRDSQVDDLRVLLAELRGEAVTPAAAPEPTPLAPNDRAKVDDLLADLKDLSK